MTIFLWIALKASNPFPCSSKIYFRLISVCIMADENGGVCVFTWFFFLSTALRSPSPCQLIPSSPTYTFGGHCPFTNKNAPEIQAVHVLWNMPLVWKRNAVVYSYQWFQMLSLSLIHVQLLHKEYNVCKGRGWTRNWMLWWAQHRPWCDAWCLPWQVYHLIWVLID